MEARKFSKSFVNPTPHLARRTDFEIALKDYRISHDGERILGETPYVSMVGLTAVGRNTIIKELLKTGNYYFLISDTTRPPRYNEGVLEQNGVEYFFRTEEEMLAEIKDGSFVEAEIIHSQQVSGTSIREVKKAHDSGKIAIADQDIEGGCHMASLKPDSVRILLLPPSFDEWLRRINKRTPLGPTELHRRLQQATKVIGMALSTGAFTFVINDVLSEAVREVDDLARLGVHHNSSESHAHGLAQKIYNETCEFLRKNAPEVTPWHS